MDGRYEPAGSTVEPDNKIAGLSALKHPEKQLRVFFRWESCNSTSTLAVVLVLITYRRTVCIADIPWELFGGAFRHSQLQSKVGSAACPCRRTARSAEQGLP